MLFHALERFAGGLVVAKGLRLLAEGDLRAEPIGNVAQVAKRRRAMPFEDFGVEFFTFAAPDAVDEVGEMLVGVLAGNAG